MKNKQQSNSYYLVVQLNLIVAHCSRLSPSPKRIIKFVVFSNQVFGLGFDDIQRGSYLTLKSIFHQALLLLCLGVSSSGSDRSATIASRLFGSDFVCYVISSSPMTTADIIFPGLTDIRLLADEMFLSCKADGVVLEILAFTWFNTSLQQVG